MWSADVEHCRNDWGGLERGGGRERGRGRGREREREGERERERGGEGGRARKICSKAPNSAKNCRYFIPVIKVAAEMKSATAKFAGEANCIRPVTNPSAQQCKNSILTNVFINNPHASDMGVVNFYTPPQCWVSWPVN